MTRPPRTMGAAELEQALADGIAYSQPDYGEQAAVQLLIAHGTWLHRDELRRHIQLVPSEPKLLAWIDWPSLTQEPDQSPASGSERGILRLACSLAGHLPNPANFRWTVLEMFSSLDAKNALMASRAVAMAAIGPDTVGSLT